MDDSESLIRIPQFYRSKEWLPSNEYDARVKNYNYILDTLKNLVLEMTRLSNYICELLEYFGPQSTKAMLYVYEALYGIVYRDLPSYYDETYDSYYQKLEVEYSYNEKQFWSPYYNISTFQQIMYKRENGCYETK